MKISELRKYLTPEGYIGIGVVIVFLVIMGLGLYWFITAPGRAQTEAATARAGATMADARTQAAQEASDVRIENEQYASKTDAVTEKNRNEILSKSGASSAVDRDVAAAGIRAICMRDSARNDPECKRLFGTRSR